MLFKSYHRRRGNRGSKKITEDSKNIKNLLIEKFIKTLYTYMFVKNGMPHRYLIVEHLLNRWRFGENA